MAWTDPTTRSASDFLTAAIFNADVIDNLAYLLAKVEPDTLTNKSVGSVSAGTVVIVDAANNTAFKTTTSGDSEDVLGVVMETITTDAAGRVATFGVVTVLVQGNVTRGNFLSTSTTAGRAKDAGTTKTNATFAIALTGYAGGGAGTVTALLLPTTMGGVAPANVIAYTSAGSAPSGWAEYTSGRGRVIVGLPSGGTNAGTVGSALTNLNTNTHTHTYSTVVAHPHTISYAAGTSSSGNQVQRGGAAAGTLTTGNASDSGTTTGSADTTMPYIQLMTIQKS